MSTLRQAEHELAAALYHVQQGDPCIAYFKTLAAAVHLAAVLPEEQHQRLLRTIQQTGDSQ